MSRVKELQKYISKVLAEKMDDDQKRAGAVAHLHGVSLAAVMIVLTSFAVIALLQGSFMICMHIRAVLMKIMRIREPSTPRKCWGSLILRLRRRQR